MATEPVGGHLLLLRELLVLGLLLRQLFGPTPFGLGPHGPRRWEWLLRLLLRGLGKMRKHVVKRVISVSLVLGAGAHVGSPGQGVGFASSSVQA